MFMNLVTIYSTHNYIEAGIIKGRLESEGLVCFLKDEYSVTIDPLIGYSVNWIKVQVRPQDEGLARVIIDTPNTSDELET
jgi:Putative prokaryotic signal transducing protein